LGLGYQSAWAAAHLPTRRQRNEFYTQVGKLTPAGEAGARCLAGLTAEHDPAALLRRITETRQ
jgi:hypothetical protein